MRDNYLFDCDCDACTNDFVTSIELPTNDLTELITAEDKAHLKNINKQFATDNHQRFAQYLTQYDYLYPCKELNLVQHHFRESLHIIAGNYSIKLKHLNSLVN